MYEVYDRKGVHVPIGDLVTTDEGETGVLLYATRPTGGNTSGKIVVRMLTVFDRDAGKLVPSREPSDSQGGELYAHIFGVTVRQAPEPSREEATQAAETALGYGPYGTGGRPEIDG